MSSETIYADGFLSIYVDSETSAPKYKFTINKHLKMSEDVIVSGILKYMEWEFKYMSKESIIETLEGVFLLVSSKLSLGRAKLLESMKNANREWIIKMIWEIILNGEGMSEESRNNKNIKKKFLKISR